MDGAKIQKAKRPSRPVTEESEPAEEEKPYVPPTMIVASDLHYQSPKMTDFRESLDTRAPLWKMQALACSLQM